MAALPSGTITFLFTDIEGSTRTWEAHPDAMAKALAKHDKILRESTESHGGVVFKMVGDACCAAFATAPEALLAGISAQEALARESWGAVGAVSVRAALHTGAADERDGDYFGPPLNRVARLLAAGHGGQILLSAATHELVRDRLPTGFTLLDLGGHRLRDLTRPEHVFQIVSPDHQEQFPPLSTLDSRPNNLPIQATALIGREREVREICAMLRPDPAGSGQDGHGEDPAGLVTLTGPAGTGKTRLALQAGAELLDTFADGVFFVPLAPVSDSDLVISAIAGALSVREAGGQSISDTVRNHLTRKNFLLILDNFEQVVDAAGPVAELLQNCAGIRILVTSRTVLHMYGERQYGVPPLSVPDPKNPEPLERLTQYESVALFIQRATDAKRGFEATNENAPAIAEICYRLDGLPLAVELAAARVNMLPPKAILDRLSDRLKLLTGGARNIAVRHQTLRNAIEWSYELLDESGQRLFRRLGVFVGGWTLEAAESVCDEGGDGQVFDGMSSLVEKSLVRAVGGQGDELRFDMLETMREYALDQLQAAVESDLVARKHAEYFLILAQEAEPHLVGPDQVTWLNRLEADHDNLRMALAWWVDAGDGDASARFALALYELWTRRGYLTEGRDRLRRMLDAHGLEAASRAKILDRAGFLSIYVSSLDQARAFFTESMALAREIGDEVTLAKSLHGLAVIESDQDNPNAADALLSESLALRMRLEDKRGIAICLSAQASRNLKQGHIDEGIALAAQSLALFQECGDTLFFVEPLMCLGHAAAREGDRQRAAELLGQSIRVSRETGDGFSTAMALLHLGRTELMYGGPGSALGPAREALLTFRDLGAIGFLETSVDLSADVAAGEERYLHAAILWSAVAAARGTSVLAPIGSLTRERRGLYVGRAREALGEDAWRRACEEGRAMSLDEAVALALQAPADELV